MPIPALNLIRSRGIRRAVLVVLAVESALVAGVYLFERARLKREEMLVEMGDPARLGKDWWRVEGPGIERPPTRPADESDIHDDEEILGIIVDGHPRAYRVAAFLDPSTHIVNDRIGDRPVTVTYCNISDCARAYAGPTGGATLDIAQAGLQGLDMIVKAGGAYYRHQTGKPIDPDGPAFPFDSYPIERRRWGDWRREHPTTDLYDTPPPRISTER